MRTPGSRNRRGVPAVEGLIYTDSDEELPRGEARRPAPLSAGRAQRSRSAVGCKKEWHHDQSPVVCLGANRIKHNRKFWYGCRWDPYESSLLGAAARPARNALILAVAAVKYADVDARDRLHRWILIRFP